MKRGSGRERRAAAPSRAPRSHPGPGIRFALDAPGAGDASPAWSWAAWGVVAAFGLAMLWIAFRLHLVGDYSTESDFYGGYAAGARLIQHGRWDFARYPVVGPGYETALALLGPLFRDLFTAARAISVGSALATMLCWRAILVRRADTRTAFAFLLLLAVNGVFVRYGVSATTDLLAIGFQSAAFAAVLAWDSRFAPFASGVLAGLATLTRYNSVAVVPAAVACYAGLAPASRTSPGRAIAMHLAGFGLVVVPWTAVSLANGHLPGGSLFGMFSSFYQVEDASRNVQDLTSAMADSIEALRHAGRAAGGGVAGTLTRMLFRVPGHLVEDARQLLGIPVALLALAGFAFAWTENRLRSLAPLLAGGAFLFLSLAPVFYSDRYSMAVLPAYLVLAAFAAASPSFALRLTPPGVNLKWLVVIAGIAFTLRATVVEQRRVLGNQPIEVIAAGEALAKVASPGDLVVSRKAQIGFYSGLTTVPFPRMNTLAELADYSRRMKARWLYFSWYEALIRPEFAYLLDPTAEIPGLERVYSADRNPVAIYRIGTGFGIDPSWVARRDSTDLHLSRALVRYLPPAQTVEAHLVLASDALDHDDPNGALEHLAAASRGAPPSPVALRLSGHALRAIGEPAEAANAYGRALAADPNDVESRLGLGWARLALGDSTGAARDWRPAIGPRADAVSLEQMARLYARLGDRANAQAALDEIGRRREPR